MQASNLSSLKVGVFGGRRPNILPAQARHRNSHSVLSSVFMNANIRELVIEVGDLYITFSTYSEPTPLHIRFFRGADWQPPLVHLTQQLSEYINPVAITLILNIYLGPDEEAEIDASFLDSLPSTTSLCLRLTEDNEDEGEEMGQPSDLEQLTRNIINHLLEDGTLPHLKEFELTKIPSERPDYQLMDSIRSLVRKRGGGNVGFKVTVGDTHVFNETADGFLPVEGSPEHVMASTISSHLNTPQSLTSYVDATFASRSSLIYLLLSSAFRMKP